MCTDRWCGRGPKARSQSLRPWSPCHSCRRCARCHRPAQDGPAHSSASPSAEGRSSPCGSLPVGRAGNRPRHEPSLTDFIVTRDLLVESVQHVIFDMCSGATRLAPVTAKYPCSRIVVRDGDPDRLRQSGSARPSSGMFVRRESATQHPWPR